MENKLSYNDHVKHYIADAHVSDYFSPNKFEQLFIRRRYQLFKSLLHLKKEDRLFEIGSGGGEALNIIKNSNVIYFPGDLSHKNLRTILSRSETKIQPTVSDIYMLPFKDNSFEKIICSEVLEHLQTPEHALKELYRVLKPGGRMVISVPYKERISYHLCIHCNQPTPANAHLHTFDESKLSGIAIDAGFRIIRILTFGNKLGHLLKINILLKVLPYSVWRFVDEVLNLFIPKKSHLLIVITRD